MVVPRRCRSIFCRLDNWQSIKEKEVLLRREPQQTGYSSNRYLRTAFFARVGHDSQSLGNSLKQGRLFVKMVSFYRNPPKGTLNVVSPELILFGAHTGSPSTSKPNLTGSLIPLESEYRFPLGGSEVVPPRPATLSEYTLFELGIVKFS